MKLLVGIDKPEVLNDVESKLLNVFAEETLFFISQSIKHINFEPFKAMTETNKIGKFVGELGLLVQEGTTPEKLISEIFNYINNEPFINFVRDVRDLTLLFNELPNSTVIVFKKLVLLAIRAYNQGKVEGIDLDTNKVILSDVLDSHDLILLTRLVMHFSNNTVAVEGARLETYNKEELEEMLDLYLGIDDSGYVNALQSADITDVTKLHSSIYIASLRLDFNAIFNQVSQDYFTPVNLAAVVINPEISDDFTGEATRLITTSILKPFALFDRKKLHINNGVRLVFANPSLGFRSLQFREVHDGGTHLINAMYLMENGLRRSFAVDMTDISTAYSFMSSDTDCSALLTILGYYGALDEYNPTLTEFARACVPEGQLVIEENFTHAHGMVKTFVEGIKGILNDMPNMCYSAHLINTSNYMSIDDKVGDHENSVEIINNLKEVESELMSDEQNELSQKYFIGISDTRKIVLTNK